jgi:hypothetical protein
MDPDATLAEIRTLNEKAANYGELSGDEANRLVELVESLDEWLTNGGFLPTPWNALRSPLKA